MTLKSTYMALLRSFLRVAASTKLDPPRINHHAFFRVNILQNILRWDCLKYIHIFSVEENGFMRRYRNYELFSNHAGWVMKQLY